MARPWFEIELRQGERWLNGGGLARNRGGKQLLRGLVQTMREEELQRRNGHRFVRRILRDAIFDARHRTGGLANLEVEFGACEDQVEVVWLLLENERRKGRRPAPVSPASVSRRASFSELSRSRGASATSFSSHRRVAAESP